MTSDPGFGKPTLYSFLDFSWRGYFLVPMMKPRHLGWSAWAFGYSFCFRELIAVIAQAEEVTIFFHCGLEKDILLACLAPDITPAKRCIVAGLVSIELRRMPLTFRHRSKSEIRKVRKVEEESRKRREEENSGVERLREEFLKRRNESAVQQRQYDTNTQRQRLGLY